MRVSRIPLRMRSASVTGIDRDQFGMIWAYAQNIYERIRSGVGLILVGPPGVGKTWAMAALTNHLIHGKIGVDYEWLSSPDLFSHIGVFKGKWEWDKYRDQSWEVTLGNVPWLVINDLGKEYRGGELGVQISYKFGRVLRERSEKLLITHITTNLNIDGILALYGESITSLLAEMDKVYEVTGPDRRKQK